MKYLAIDIRSELREVILMMRQVEDARKRAETPPSDHSLAGHCLMKHPSFRLPASASSDPLVGFRELFRAIRRMYNRRSGLKDYDPRSQSLVLTSRPIREEAIREYIELSSGETISALLFKDHCGTVDVGLGRSVLTLCLFALPKAVQCLWAPDRANRALRIREVLEISWILAVTRIRGVRKIYDFVPYEVDSNLLALLLMGRGIEVVKIPSSNPLMTHNRVMIADCVIFSTMYHFDELKVIGETIRASRIEVWPPERAYTYIHHYQPPPDTPRGTIGYYSTAMWARQEKGFTDNGMNLAVSEEMVLRDLNTFLRENPTYTVTLFLHPMEKHPDWIERARAHYKARLDEGRYNFAPFDLPTPHAFHHVDVAVGYYSTVIFERLFAGYKMLFGNYTSPDFPVPGSPLGEIMFRSEGELSEKLLRALSISTRTFFEENRLTSYTLSEQPGLSTKLP